MKFYSKAIFSLSICILLIFSFVFIFTGCSNNNTQNHHDSDETTTEATKKPRPEREYSGTWHGDSRINIPGGTNPVFNNCMYFHYVFISDTFNPDDTYYFTITRTYEGEESIIVSNIESDYEESVSGYVTGASAFMSNGNSVCVDEFYYFLPGVYTVYIYRSSEMVTENELVFQDSCTITTDNY